MRVSSLCRSVLSAFILLAAAAPAGAWHEEGHQAAARAAIAVLRESNLPAFFLAGAGQIAHCAVDPDCFTRPIGSPDLHDAETGEHYFDVELIEGNVPPARRYDFLALCYARKLDPRKVGLLPYSIADWTGRLAVAFAEHRRWPQNPYVRAKCLVYAGLLAHYAADLQQPLHTTIHYDGRQRPDGNSPRTGIHLRVDALLGKLAVDANVSPAGVRAAAFNELMPAIFSELAASHALVETVYGLEKDLPAYESPLDANSSAGEFARGRLRACAGFLASLYLTAWKDSQSIRLPEWHHRETTVETPPQPSRPAPSPATANPAEAVRAGS